MSDQEPTNQPTVTDEVPDEAHPLTVVEQPETLAGIARATKPFWRQKDQRPSLGRIVIFTGSDGVECAAIVAGLTGQGDADPEDERLTLAVLNPRARTAAGPGVVEFRFAVPYSEERKPLTWAWPARV